MKWFGSLPLFSKQHLGAERRDQQYHLERTCFKNTTFAHWLPFAEVHYCLLSSQTDYLP